MDEQARAERLAELLEESLAATSDEHERARLRAELLEGYRATGVAAEAPPTRAATCRYNRLAVAGLLLGLLSFRLYDIGVFPLAGAGVSVAGLATFERGRQRGVWLAAVGLVASLMSAVAWLGANG